MSTLKEIHVPDIGNHDRVPVIEVLIKPGDHIDKDDALVTLESDKATMEIPAPFSGTVKEVALKVGDEVSTGALIARVLSDEGTADHDGVIQKEKASLPASATESSQPVPKATVMPDKPSNELTIKRPPLDAGLPMPVAELPYASPAVRAFARELGVDIAQVEGSGRGGRIQRIDISGHVKQALASASHSVAGGGSLAGQSAALLPWPRIDFSRFGAIEEKPLGRIQKISGANLARNWAMIPHVTQHEDADITELESFRKCLAAENKDLKITPLVFQMKAVVAALKAYPSFNASLDQSGEKLILKKYFHIGIAVDTSDGLVVPVIRDVDRKGLLELARELTEVSTRAREKKLNPADMSGGCFSISSLGGIGGSAFTPIVNAPEVAILGVSRAITKPLWNGKEFVPRLMLPLSLSYDHRVIDGALAARFAVFVARQLADIRRLLL